MPGESPAIARGLAATRLWSAAAAFVTLAALLPVVFGRYGFSDDYSVLHQELTNPREFSDFLRSMGRPLAVPVVQTLFQLFPSIDQLRWVRLIGISGAAACSAFLCAKAIGLGFKPPLAFLLGALFVALPSTVVAGTWATLVHGTWTVLVALCGGALLLSSQRQISVQTLLSTVLITAATCSYQPAAMAFWLIWLLWLLSPASRAEPMRAIGLITARFLGVMAVASVVGIVVQQSGARRIGMTGERASLSTDVLGKLWHAFSAVWPRVANPWSVAPAFAVAGVVSALILLGLLVVPLVPVQRRVVGVAAVLATLLLGYAPSMATTEGWISSRSMLAIMPVLPICLVVIAQCLADRMKLETRLLAAGAILSAVLSGAWVASFVETNIVSPQERELTMARAAILEATEAPSLTVLPSSWQESLATLVDHDEIGLPSTSRDWVPVPLTELVYREKHGRWYGQVHFRARDDRSPNTDAAVLDFAVLLDARR